MTTRRTNLDLRHASPTRTPGRSRRSPPWRVARVARIAAAATLAWLGASLPGQASAVTENYCTFPSPLTTWTLNGDAFEAQGSVIRMSSSATLNEASTAFISTPLSLTATTSLHASFRFTMGPTATGGDGIAFVFQSSAAGPAALGADDHDLGFLGAGKITPSVVVDFVTYANSGGLTNANRVGLLTLTSTTTTVVTQGTPSFTVASATSAMVYAWVDYTPGSLSVYISNTATKPATALISNAAVNLFTLLGANAYVGFGASTGATAAETNEQDIYELELSTSGVPCSCEGDSACTGAAGTPACGTAGICAVCSATNHSACTGATPVCNTATSTCVGCLTDANCSGSTPICNTTTHTCAPCGSNADCSGSPATPYCDNLAASAQLGTCVACIADPDCPPATPRCNLASNTCTGCLSNTDCGGDTPICKAGTCSACAADSDCTATPSTPACEVWGACGQCSSTNGAQCTGGTAVCDFPTGTCVHCEFNTDCAGTTPVCNTTSHMCQACATNADCVGNPSGPACVTSGMKAGSCVVCQSDSDCTSPGAPKCDVIANTCVACLSSGDCKAPTPVCNTTSNLCVGCASNADCTTAAPVCDTASQTCKPCQNDYAASNPGPDSCPTAALPACQPTGAPLAGQCGQCSSINNTACSMSTTTPICVTGSATCGCTKDSDCNPDSYCDTSKAASGTCTTGCRVTDGGVDNCATGEYCTQTNGSIGTCMSEPCNSNGDCKAPTPVCDTLGQPQVCVQCINDSDCPMANGMPQVCDGKNHCVQCTSMNSKNCSASSTGSACLGNETCGCAMDSDCGGPTSDRICDMSSGTCGAGCRGMGGNGCPSPMVCSSKTSAAGVCETAPMDAGMMTTMDAGTGEAGMGDASTSGGSGGGSSSSSGGCGCRVASSGGGEEGAAIGFAALALGLAARRRRRAA